MTSSSETDTCDTCGGTSIILLLPEALTLVRNLQRKGPREAPEDTPRSVTPDTDTDVTDISTEMQAYLSIRDRFASAHVCAASQSVPRVAPPVVPTVSGDTAVSANPAPASLGNPTPACLGNPASAGSASSANAAPANTDETPYGSVPPPSTVIPGFHSLNPKTLVPKPRDTVFAVAGGMISLPILSHPQLISSFP